MSENSIISEKIKSETILNTDFSIESKIKKSFEKFKLELCKEIDIVVEEKLKKETNKNSTDTLNIYNNVYDINGKVFVKRKSLLTKLLIDSHLSSLYNIIFAMFTFCCILVFIELYLGLIRLPLHLHINSWLRSDVFIFPLFLLQMLVLSFGIYPITYFHFKSSLTVKRLLKSFYVIYLIYFAYFCIKMSIEDNLKPISIAVVMIECFRLLMKNHSFFIENIGKIDNDETSFPTFSQFIYFSFAPTMIYRDSYPRNKSIRWMVVIRNFSRFIFCFTFVYIIVEYFFVVQNSKHLADGIILQKIIIDIFFSSIPGTIVLLNFFFGFLHSWLNAWAELLRFGDRMFYTDWWNSTNYAEYYKKWNVVVQDWLRTYIFNEIRHRLPIKYKNALGSIIVIVLSSIVHEIVMAMISKSFCPYYLISFGIFGVILKFFDPNIYFDPSYKTTFNFVLWLSFMLGNGILVMFYSKEVQISYNCPFSNVSSPMYYFLPRFLDPNCYQNRSQ